MKRSRVSCITMSDLNCSAPLLNRTGLQSEDGCLSLDEYLEKYLGPRRSPVFVPVCVTYLLIFSVGAVGNALTCLVIARHRVMRTPTNFYLFSLAASDLLVLLLGMPLELYELWRNYPFLLGTCGCYFKTFLFETVCFASVLNVTALSVERYIAVVHPLRAKCVVTRAHAKRVIFCVWVTSMVCALPNTGLHGIFTLPKAGGRGTEEGEPGSATCMLVKPRWIYNLIIQISTFCFFILPMVTISALYLLIGLRLKKERTLRTKTQRCHAQSDYANGAISHPQQESRRQQVTRMLFVLVVMFGICWAPFHTDRLMWSFMDELSDSNVETFRAYEYVHVISGVFFYLSSAVNPILYNLMSTRFREMFKEVMCVRKRGSAHRKRSLSITRATVRSVLSDVTPGVGSTVADYEFYECHENETTFD